MKTTHGWIEVPSSLPESDHPYRIVQFKRILIATNIEHGCFAFEGGEWKQCQPISNNPLVYDKQWFFSA